MKIAFNPSTVAALTSPPNNKDITFDLKGHNIFARGVKFYGTDTNTWRPVVDSLTSNSTTSSLSANQGRVLKSLIDTLSTDISNQYALRDGSNATGRWQGGLACFDVRDTNYIPRDLNMGLELLFLRNNTNDLNDGGIYNGVFSFRQWSGTSDWSGGKAHQLSFTDNGNIWHRTSNGDDSWETWKKLAYSTDIPSSLKNPYALTISLNGTSQGPYDGSAAKSINITPSSIGAATSGHTHDDRYLKLSGGTMQLGEGLKFHADDNYFGTYADARIISLLDGNDTICDGGLIIDERATLNGKEYVTELLRIRDSEFKWRGADILHSGNYSGILDSRYYTESEVNSLLNTKLDRVNLSTGGWNPRGYNLAADYCYNGGDLSISESGGQIHVSIDGYFWQNEGQYRVLDTSDIGGIRGSISIQQYLSNTDTNWYPLIWGGDDHRNTYTSTGAVYKSHDVLSWQTSSQTLYATRLATNSINLQSSRGIYQVTSGGTSPYKGLQLPDLQSNGLGIFSRVGNGSDEGGIIISEDTSVIYNSFDTGWGLSVRDKDLNKTDISSDNTIAFGVRQDHRAYSLGGFEKSGSSNSYVLLGGGDHKLESALNVSNADTLDQHHETYFMRNLGVMGSDWNDNITAGCYKVQNPSKNTPGNYNFGMGLTLATENHADGENRICQIYFSHTHDYAMAVRTHNNPNGFAQDGSDWTSWGLVPTTAGNIASATKLQTARSIWGQSFDGTADVDNTLRIRHTTGHYCEGIRIQTSDGNWATIILGATADSGTNVNAWSIHRKSDNNFCISRNSSDGANGLVMTSTGMGLGTTAPTQRLDVVGNIRATGQIVREGSSQAWVNGRSGALLRETSVAGYHTLWSLKTTDGSWDFGEYNAGSGWNNVPVLSYITDSNYASGNNTTTYQIRFPLDSGTVALTKNIPSSLPANGGNADTVDGVHMDWSSNYTDGNYLAIWDNAGNCIRPIPKGSVSVGYASSADRTRALKYTGTGNSEITAYQTGGSYMGRSGWASYIICNHGDGSTYYSQTIAMPFLGSPIYRRLENGTDRGWKKFYTEENPPSWDNITNKPSTFTPSSHTHTWTSITDKIVAGNEFNIVNAGFKSGMWFNYLPINNRDSTATVQGYHFGNGAKGYTSVVASGFVKKGSSSSYVLLGDGGHQTISSLSVNYANSSGSATSAAKVIVTQHTSNDTNYPLVWSNQPNNSSVTENQLFKSWEDLYYNPKNKILAVGGYFMGPWARFTDQNGALIIGDDISARISAIGDQIIFNTGSALRFGETAWDWNQWAGLKYTHSTKTIYLGIADNSVFGANSAQGGGTINLRAGVSTIETPNINFGNITNGLGYGLEWTCGDNDFARIKAGATRSNAGYLEIATADDGAEPIYVRQYTGVFSTVARTLTLLDASGYSYFPSYINIGGNENNNSSPDRVWGSNGSDSFLRSYRTSALNVNYASSAGNANTLGGTSLGGLFTAFGNNAHNITATIGGVTKSFLVNYAADADKVDGVHITWAGALTSTSHLVAWESDGSALRDINPANVSVGYASGAGNADTVDGYHASQLAKAWSGTSTTMNYVAQNNGNYFGMITGTGTGGFPNNDGGWTHVFQASYNNNSGGDGNTGNFWVTQIANRAGTTSPWIRSRSGGSSISTGWTSWVRIMTKNDVDNYYWANNKITTSPKIDAQVRVSSLGAGCLTNIANTVMATNWLRATGNTGIYFQDYAGGLYMSDTTWIRTYNKKAMMANGYAHSSHNSDDAVLLAGGGYAQGVPVKYYGMYSVSISSGAGIATQKAGNFKFVTDGKWNSLGVAKFTCTYPQGYNTDNTFIWAQGNNLVGTTVPVQASVLQGASSTIFIHLTAGDNPVSGYCKLYFICF